MDVITKVAKHWLSMDSRIHTSFYRCVFWNCITLWYLSCNALDRKALRRVLRSAQRIASSELPAYQNLYRQHCM